MTKLFCAKAVRPRIKMKNSKTLRCNDCNFTTKKIYFLKIHTVKHLSSNDQNLCCSECGVEFEDRKELKSHIMTAHFSNFLHLCQECGYYTNTKQTLKRHVKVHVETRDVSCSECAYTCKTKQTLKDHISRVHLKTRFSCPDCNQNFAAKTSMHRHRKVKHTKTHKFFYCPYCDYKSAKKYTVDVHLRTHTGERPYPCSDCKLAFKTADALRVHTRCHTGGKPYSCSECNFRSTTSKLLKEHIIETHKVTPSVEREASWPKATLPFEIKSTSKKNKKITPTRVQLTTTLMQESSFGSRPPVEDSAMDEACMAFVEVSTDSKANLTTLVMLDEASVDSEEDHASLVELRSPVELKENHASSMELDESPVAVVLKGGELSRGKTKIISIKDNKKPGLKTSSRGSSRYTISTNNTSSGSLVVTDSDGVSRTVVRRRRGRPRKDASLGYPFCGTGSPVEDSGNFVETPTDSIATALVISSNFDETPVEMKKDHSSLMEFEETPVANPTTLVKLDDSPFNIKEDLTSLIKLNQTFVDDKAVTKPYSSKAVRPKIKIKKSKTLRCNDCNYTTKKIYFLKIHAIKHLSSKERNLSCSECSAEFGDRNGLKSHIMAAHFSNFLHLCQECGYYTNTKQTLKRHIKVHVDTRSVSCSECAYTCKTKQTLKDHISGIHLKKRFSCPDCKQDYSTNASMHNHRRVKHTKTHKTFYCPQCDYKSTKKYARNVHLRTHTDERPYPCTDCKLAFKTTDALRVHTRCHTGGKPYSCSECNFRSRTSKLLKEHAETHKGLEIQLSECKTPEFGVKSNEKPDQKTSRGSLDAVKMDVGSLVILDNDDVSSTRVVRRNRGRPGKLYSLRQMQLRHRKKN